MKLFVLVIIDSIPYCRFCSIIFFMSQEKFQILFIIIIIINCSIESTSPLICSWNCNGKFCSSFFFFLFGLLKTTFINANQDICVEQFIICISCDGVFILIESQQSCLPLKRWVKHHQPNCTIRTEYKWSSEWRKKWHDKGKSMNCYKFQYFRIPIFDICNLQKCAEGL